MEPLKGIEPSLPAWKAGARPLCHTRKERLTDSEPHNLGGFIRMDLIGTSHLSKVERVKGIEPSSQAWEARILPLNHTRKIGALCRIRTDAETLEGFHATTTPIVL